MDLERMLRRSILESRPYVPGRNAAEVAARYGVRDVVKLASNEHPIGPSPRVVAAMSRALSDSHLYPAENGPLLRQRLSRDLGISPDSIVLGNGSDNCLLVTLLTFVNEGEQVLIPVPTFGMFESLVRVAGGDPIFHPIGPSFRIKPLDLLSRVTEETKVVILCNPNNPTGTMFTDGELSEFLDRLPDRIIVILDEAYAEFVDDPSYPRSPEVIGRYPNVVAVRTFSKVFALAGMRLGYVMASPDVAQYLTRVREPLCVNTAVYAGALAALDDTEYLALTLDTVRRARELLCEGLDEMGLRYVPSQTNFVLVDLARPCDEVVEKLLTRGLIVRAGHMWDLGEWIRISVGTPAQIRRLLGELKTVLCE